MNVCHVFSLIFTMRECCFLNLAFYLPRYFSMHYFRDVPLAIFIAYISFTYIVNHFRAKSLLYQYKFLLSQYSFRFIYLCNVFSNARKTLLPRVDSVSRPSIEERSFFCTYTTTRVTDICHLSPRRTRVRAMTCCRKCTMTKSEFFFTLKFI